MKKKIAVISFSVILLLLVTGLTEYLFYRQDESVWVGRFEYYLHKQEAEADKILHSFRDSVHLEKEEWDADVVYVAFRAGKIFFWSDEITGDEQFYDRLMTGGNFLKIGSTYYEVRKRRHGDIDYFALLRIKDEYPYTNKYIKNRLGSFLKIAEENVDEFDISLSETPNSHLIREKDGEFLFYLEYGENYKERASNYLLLGMYLLFFLSLFYVYAILLKHAASWKTQLLYFFMFALFFVGLRYFMQTYRLPPTAYRLPIFDEHLSDDFFIVSIGDLLMSTFCVFQLIYITLFNFKINFLSPNLRRYRYLVVTAIFLSVFLYVDFFNYVIDMVVITMDVHLNMARLVHIGMPSILAFITICMAGLLIVIPLYGMVNMAQQIFSFSSLVKVSGFLCLLFGLAGMAFRMYVNLWDCFFIWVVVLLVAINKYILKRDIQRSIYMLVIFLLAGYIVIIAKKYEQRKEQRQRLEYATELIEERDYNFEERLVEMDLRLRNEGQLTQILKSEGEDAAARLLNDEILDLAGYNYFPDITFCQVGDSLWLPDKHQQEDCRRYFEEIILKHGCQVGETAFFSIDIFDGYVTYIGRFRYGDTWLYLRFDAARDDEGAGYPQILSRKSHDGIDDVYLYSYAKYVHGELVASSGRFVYYKKIAALDRNIRNVRLIQKDMYSHMVIPVERDNILVISLPRNTFSLYYMNVLYAFFVCMLLASYGLFFYVNRGINFQKGTLKARIKNSMISLVFGLFVILTALSIYTNIKTLEGRHNNKAVEFLRYVNKELEGLECIEQEKCPEIQQILSEMSELLMIDINIYNAQGRLAATSRPEIFRLGFESNFANPRALNQIYTKGSTSYIEHGRIGELGYISAYMPLVLDSGETYLLNVPYFNQNDELNLDIIIMVIITVNIAIIMMVLAFILSGVLAEQVTKPLQLLNEKLKAMRLGGKNEKISYARKDEVGRLVKEYNDMVDKLEENITQLARSERENAWREMARQIAHEIKNPLTPMKLNIQFMLRSLQMEDTEKFRQRFREVSGILIEQIDNLASIASAFSDFAKMSEAHQESFDIGELLKNCIFLFEKNVDTLDYRIDPQLFVFADKGQMRRVFVNLLKNAEQSIPEGRQGHISVSAYKEGAKVNIRICDNGCGIPEEIRHKIFEPNFTTKSAGTGLGLAICRRIVENMGGEIGFKTVSGEGSEFFIYLESAANANN